ncbi:hypothetical protein H6F61_26660 [Cyanobacteria bacterium FACHB-472]|nr:hypothetical protein [Cyanobacteria bacterium FACHB-472]
MLHKQSLPALAGFVCIAAAVAVRLFIYVLAIALVADAFKLALARLTAH